MNGKIDSRQTALAGVSGETVIAKISGQTILGKISGETVLAKSSGDTYIAKVSGETITALVSGATVISKISGEAVRVSGDVVAQGSGAIWNTYAKAYFYDGTTWRPSRGNQSGELILASGAWVMASTSGETVFAKISGDTVIALVSGATVIALVSGATVIAKISGETVLAKISGETITQASGATVRAALVAATPPSGETDGYPGWIGVHVGPGPSISAGMRQVGSLSGGVVLNSGGGAILSVTVKNLAGNADMYIGGATTKPYSGSGFCLSSGEGVTVDTDNLADVLVFACTSGQYVSWIALDYYTA